MAISAGDAVLELGVDNKGLERGLNAATGKINNAADKWGKSMKIAGGVMIAAVAAVGVTSLKMAADFDSAMREVNTMMLLNEEEFSEFSGEVKELARTMGVDAVESAKALYQAISAGVPKDNAIEFLKIATEAAIGGVTDTETAVDGLTTVINAFKLPMSDAQKVADIMFTTVKGGKTTFEELSASMFQVAPIAAASGVSFEEVSAALATMTKQGVPTTIAVTQLRQAMVALQKPTKEMNEVIGELGYGSGQAMLEELGLAKSLDVLRNATGGNNEMLMKMFGSVEAGAAVLALTGENAEMFAADIEAMGGAAGAATDAFDQMEKSTSRQMEKMKSQLQGMAISIGTALMPALQSFMKILTPIIEKVGAWLEKNPALTVTILAAVGGLGALLLVGGFLLPMLGSIVALGPMVGAAFTMMLGPVGLIILGIAALIAIGVLVWKNWDTIKEKAVMIWTGIVDFFKDIWENITKIFTQHWDKILAILFPAVGIPILIARNWEAVKDALLTPVRAAAQGIEAAINWIIRSLNKLKFKVPDWIPGLGGKEFGFNIKEIKITEFAKGGIIPEPTLLYGLKSMRPYAIAGERGPEVVSPVGSSTVTNEFNISQLVVREEADVGRIARELLRMQQLRVSAHG